MTARRAVPHAVSHANGHVRCLPSLLNCPRRDEDRPMWPKREGSVPFRDASGPHRCPHSTKFCISANSFTTTGNSTKNRPNTSAVIETNVFEALSAHRGLRVPLLSRRMTTSGFSPQAVAVGA
eukprot:3042497-Rhodomonas_salina.1